MRSSPALRRGVAAWRRAAAWAGEIVHQRACEIGRMRERYFVKAL